MEVRAKTNIVTDVDKEKVRGGVKTPHWVITTRVVRKGDIFRPLPMWYFEGRF